MGRKQGQALWETRVRAAQSNSPNEVAGTSTEYSVKLMWSAAMFVADKFGHDKLEEICNKSSFKASDFVDNALWINLAQFSLFLEGVRELVQNDREFIEACAYRLKDAYGPARYVLLSLSPGAVIKLAAATLKFVAHNVSFSVVEEGPNNISLRYVSPANEPRLFCLSRQAQTSHMPTLWGLPAAELTEGKCIARGDDCCEYHLQWFARNRWIAPALGALGGVAFASLLSFTKVGLWFYWVLAPVITACLALLWETHRTYRANFALQKKMQSALQEVADGESEARREVMAFARRQREWTQMLEEQVSERTSNMQLVVERIQKMREQRATSLRGFSHDLRNPLAVLKSNAAYLRQYTDQFPEGDEVVDDIEHASQRMEDLLGELMSAALAESGMISLTPQPLQVSPLTERLRRRMRALVHGRNIRVSVFNTREAPQVIETDHLIIDRIIDNLLSNAAKYTEHGSIVIEVDGKPGFLTIKISDTGCGISEARIEKIFKPGSSDARARGQSSYGVGLSVVVQLLGQLGGQLEVMSQEGHGTTFWAHFPIKIAKKNAQAPSESRMENVVSEVVRIRKITPETIEAAS